MRAVAVAAVTLALLAGCTAPQGASHRYERVLTARAEPGEVVATELAFARAAQEKGQWTAFAEYAAEEAMMFVPQPVNARQWLKGRKDPAQSVAWQPHEVWSSCDGSLAVTRGAAQWPGNAHGEFMTVWKRQADGSYRYVADLGRIVAAPLVAPELIVTHVADCATPVPAAQRLAQSERPAVKGQSDDGSLQYLIHTMTNGSTVTVLWWDGQFQVFGPKGFVDE